MINLKKISKNDLKKITGGFKISLVLPISDTFSMLDGLITALSANKNLDMISVSTGIQPDPDNHGGTE